jgi:hypothetical protein
MKNLDLVFEWLTYDGAPTNDPSDSTRLKNKIIETKIANTSRQQFQLITGVMNQTVPFPDNECDYLVILTDTTISVTVSGSNTPSVLVPKAAGTKTLVYFQKGGVTSLTISNTSGVTANVDIIIATY